MSKKELPSFEQDLILAHILKKSREHVLAYPEVQLTKIQEARYKQLIKRRLKHEPLAYILGHKEFYGLDFKVNKDTLIPRPETELLAESVLDFIQNTKYKTRNTIIIDVGTGSGNIIISIINTLTKSCTLRVASYKFFGIDISKKALAVAKYNAKKHNLNKKIKFIKSYLLNYFLDHCSLLTDHCIIVANLPYLSKKIYSQTSPNVKNYEPRSALLSGADGLGHYKKLFKQLEFIIEYRSLNAVHCFLEISPEQKLEIKKLIAKYFSTVKCEFKKDLAGKWRLVYFKIQSP